MKKLILLVTLLALTASMTACGGNGGSKKSSTADTDTAVTDTADTDTAKNDAQEDKSNKFKKAQKDPREDKYFLVTEQTVYWYKQKEDYRLTEEPYVYEHSTWSYTPVGGNDFKAEKTRDITEGRDYYAPSVSSSDVTAEMNSEKEGEYDYLLKDVDYYKERIKDPNNTDVSSVDEDEDGSVFVGMQDNSYFYYKDGKLVEYGYGHSKDVNDIKFDAHNEFGYPTHAIHTNELYDSHGYTKHLKYDCYYEYNEQGTHFVKLNKIEKLDTEYYNNIDRSSYIGTIIGMEYDHILAVVEKLGTKDKFEEDIKDDGIYDLSDECTEYTYDEYGNLIKEEYTRYKYGVLNGYERNEYKYIETNQIQ